MATKLAEVYCDMLLLDHPVNFVMLTFVFVSHEIFSARQFCGPSPASPGAPAPYAPPPQFVTGCRRWWRVSGVGADVRDAGKCSAFLAPLANARPRVTARADSISLL